MNTLTFVKRFIDTLSSDVSTCFGGCLIWPFWVENPINQSGWGLTIHIFVSELGHHWYWSWALSYYSDLMLSQSFQPMAARKLRSHWLKFLGQRHVAVVRQGPGLLHVQCQAIIWIISDIYFDILKACRNCLGQISIICCQLTYEVFLPLIKTITQPSEHYYDLEIMWYIQYQL